MGKGEKNYEPTAAKGSRREEKKRGRTRNLSITELGTQKAKLDTITTSVFPYFKERANQRRKSRTGEGWLD